MLVVEIHVAQDNRACRRQAGDWHRQGRLAANRSEATRRPGVAGGSIHAIAGVVALGDEKGFTGNVDLPIDNESTRGKLGEWGVIFLKCKWL